MVTVYNLDSSGKSVKVSDTNFFTSNERTGIAENTTSEVSQKSLHGINISVNKEGMIIEGPSLMIGKSLSDIQTLTYSDVFEIMRSEAKINNILSKSLLLGVNQISSISSAERIVIDKMQKEAEDLLNSKIDEYKKSASNKKDPLYRN